VSRDNKITHFAEKIHNDASSPVFKNRNARFWNITRNAKFYQIKTNKLMLYWRRQFVIKTNVFNVKTSRGCVAYQRLGLLGQEATRVNNYKYTFQLVRRWALNTETIINHRAAA